MTARVLFGLALADFRERTRRPGYLVTLAAAVLLGYLTLPPVTSKWMIMNTGGYRGIYNSAYAGTATALAGALWLMLGGFYVVRTAITRDQHTGVGQILAATPLRRTSYLIGKFCSNLMVLASMAGVLAVTALTLQLARGESRAVDPGLLLLPFVLLTLPALAVTAAAAGLFETLPALRTGAGNIVWFFLWMFLAIGGGGVPLGGLGAVAASMRQAMAAQHLPAGTEFSVGFTAADEPLPTFVWSGLHPSGGFVAGRLLLLLAAVCLAAIPALWFARFDPTRNRHGRVGALGSAAGPVPGSSTVSGADRRPPARRPLVLSPLPARAGPRLAFRRLLAGEVRILTRGISRWWWLVAAALNAAALAVPAGLAQSSDASSAWLLSAAWFWPVLIWSRLGTQRRENGLERLLGAYPNVYRQLAAEWLAGVALAVVTGLGPVLQMAATADGPRVAVWAAGAVFIPSLALMLGTISRTHRTFHVIYVILWYATVNQVAAVDYLGVVLTDGRPAGPSPLLIAGICLTMLTVTAAVRAGRHATR